MASFNLIVFFYLCCTLALAKEQFTADSLMEEISTKIAKVVVESEDQMSGPHQSVMDFLLNQTSKEAGVQVKQLQGLLKASDANTLSVMHIKLMKEIMKKIKIYGAEKNGDEQVAPRFLNFMLYKIKALAGAVVGVALGSMMGAIGGAAISTSGASGGCYGDPCDSIIEF